MKEFLFSKLEGPDEAASHRRDHERDRPGPGHIHGYGHCHRNGRCCAGVLRPDSLFALFWAVWWGCTS